MTPHVIPFDATYINLDHRTDRRSHMKRERKRVGLEATHLRAYRPEDWQGDPAKVAAMRNRTPGAIGCMMSQMAIIDRATLGRNVLVLEDDVVFCDDFWDRMFYVDSHLPLIDPEWDIFSLGGCFHIPAEWHKGDRIGRDAECTSDPRIMRVYGSWFTWAYIVRAASAKKVLDLLNEVMPECWGIDHAFILLGDRLRNYCFVPGMTKQMDNRSDIGKGDTIFSGFAKLGPYWFQPEAEMFDPTTFDWKDAKR